MIDIPPSPREKQLQTPSTHPGTPSPHASLEARIVSLREAAKKALQPDVKLLRPTDRPLNSELPHDELWEEILVKFGASKVPAAVDAQYFEDIVEAGMSWSALPFPQMPLRPYGKVCIMAPVDVTAPYQDAVPFPFLQEPIQEWGSDAEKEAIESLLAGRAGSVWDLRKASYAGEPLNMEVRPWPSLPDDVIVADDCTDAQQYVWELRARHPLQPEKMEKRRAALAKRFQRECNLSVFQELRPTLERGAAILEWKARLSRDASAQARRFDELAEQGAAFVAWPNERKWPDQPRAWKQRAEWLKMWRTPPQLAFKPMKRNDSTSSLDSWDLLSEVSWEDMQSKASECGWQEVLDQQMPVLAAVVDAISNIDKADIQELKALGKPPIGVGVVLEAVCILLTKADIQELKALGKPPIGVGVVLEAVCILLNEPPDWKTSQKLMSNPAKFLARISAFGTHIPAGVLEKLAPYISREDFTPEDLKKRSAACVGLCKWVRELYKYNVLAHASGAAQLETQSEVRECDGQAECDGQEALDEVLPAANASLSKADIQELKALGKPPIGVGVVLEAVCILLNEPPDWKTSQKLMSNPAKFLARISAFGTHIPAGVLEKLAPYISREDFTPEDLKKRSAACAGLCKWVRDLYTKNACNPILDNHGSQEVNPGFISALATKVDPSQAHWKPSQAWKP
eukprot:CAMPEP_0197703776 /NCGR_PEP_ID=MMETSP1338-20131121/125607_1 /TAXON_ID=43686 ORGANISM="Pelagodinium beii, Strain RCC1491" /NCGR_SAMPLE_ID=MMETSP1338 /ASSEMBLY_ACC=CAM_ASM_000754 /LENGTH=685 /DNA_ID=CAMNT_0043287675 /DNA_START=74 /DNA_END=2132 /DNA_ORIENTATION=+